MEIITPFRKMITPFEVLYHPDIISKDLPRISPDIKQRIKRAIEQKLMFAPQDFGVPLRRTLKGHWKLRVGDYRVIYKIFKSTVVILKIGHRREVYQP